MFDRLSISIEPCIRRRDILAVFLLFGIAAAFYFAMPLVISLVMEN